MVGQGFWSLGFPVSKVVKRATYHSGKATKDEMLLCDDTCSSSLGHNSGKEGETGERYGSLLQFEN